MYSLAEEKLNLFRANAQAFIYAFLSEKSVSAFNARVAEKRLYQLDYINKQAKTLSLGLRVEDIKEAIADGLYEQYGLYPAQILQRLARGKTVRNKQGVALIAGVGATPYDINSQTGFPTGAEEGAGGTAIYNNEVFYKVQDTENNRGEAVFNESGQQVAYFQGGQWKSGTNNSKNFWSWANAIVSGLARLLEAIGRIFGGGKRIDDFRPLQQDGFYLENINKNTASSGLILPLVVGCGIAYAILHEGEKEDKQ